MNTKSLYNLTYGVYVLTAREGDRDNGCIINTAVQVANNPTRISIAVINTNYTCDMIKATGICNISAISTEADMELFKHFGMQTGRDTDKFAGFANTERSENGLYYITKNTNAFISLRVDQSLDLGSHTLFICEMTDGEVLADAACCSYGYYQTTIKTSAPKPAQKKGFVCNVCGYVYEGDELPEGYICPLCKHGAEDFSPIGEAKAAPKKWVCTICGYVHEGDTPPEICPLCKQPADKFKEA